MRLLGPDASEIAYRALAVVSGIVALALAPLLARDRREGFIAGLLVASSYMVATYSSEARGYATMIACELGCVLAARSVIEYSGAAPSALFATLAIVGSCASLTFLHAYGALFIWTALALRRIHPPPRWIWLTLRLHFLPIAFLLVEYFAFVRGLEIGGGPHKPLSEVLGETLCWTFGLPHRAWISLVLAIVAACIVALDAVRLFRARCDEWMLTLGATCVVPALTLVVFHPEFIAPRYFLTSTVFLLVALARLATGRDAVARISQVIVLTIVVSNSLRLAQFLHVGRGKFSEALTYVVAHTRAPVATLASPDDYLLSIMTAYYGRRLPSAPKLELHPHDALPVGGTEWLLVESTDHDPNAPATMQVVGAEYALARTFTYYGQSGLSWMLYHRVR
jgi:hypothetical protein